MEAGFGIDRQQARLGADQHGARAAALGRLAGAAQVIAGNVRTDHQRFFRRMLLHPCQGQLQPRGRGIAGFLDFDGPTAFGQAEQAMHEHGRGFRLIHPALGAKDQQLDVGGIGLFKERQGRAGGKGDHVLIRRRHSHAFLAQAGAEFIGLGAAHLRECRQIQKVL